MYDVAIIGAGVTGGAIARELSRYDISIVILEKENDISTGATKANSGIIHAGYDPEENTLMAKLNVQGNKMFDAVCSELSVPFRRNGSLVLAFDDEQMEQIIRLKQRGINNGVPDLEIWSREEVLAKEPAVSPDVRGALFAGTAGIIDPMLLAISFVENAVMNGADYILNFEVSSISREGGGYKVFSRDNCVAAKCVVNAAGVYADKIHNMAAPPSFKIDPRRGQYFLLDKEDGNIVSSTIFPCPSKVGKGILVVPSIHGNLLLGPASDSVLDGDDSATTDEVLDNVRRGASLLIPKASTRNTIRTFSGVRAEADTGDFIIEEAPGAPGFIDAAGIKSPGLSAAPAIAQHVASLVGNTGISLSLKTDFDPIVKRKLLIDMTEEDQSSLIKENKLYGRVICRCENITEGDIVDAIRRPVGASTMDGVKRRCRAGMGRCQSGFCGPKVQQILARELGKPLDAIVLEREPSYILTGKTK